MICRLRDTSSTKSIGVLADRFRRGDIMVQVFFDGCGKLRWTEALNVKQEFVRMHGVEAEWLQKCGPITPR